MSTALTVRRFQPGDADAVIALWQESLPNDKPWNEPRYVICRKHNRNDDLFLVGEFDGRIVATVMAGYDGVRGWIYALAVTAEYRRNGYGRRMLEEAERELLARGCAKINLQVRETNTDVIGFYERCGFAVEPIASMGKPLPASWNRNSDHVPTISVSEEITLSGVTWEDKPAYVRYLNESKVFSTHSASMRFPYEEIDADLWITRAIRSTAETDGLLNWAIRKNDGELIGGIGLFNMKRGEKAEIGYWLAKPYWGRGIMTAVVRRLCDFGFVEYKLHRIYAHVNTTNPASSRVLEKAGFVREGLLRNHDIHNGKPADLLILGLLPPA